MADLAPGVRLSATQPCDYEMSYADGTRRYREPFAILGLSAAYVAAVGGGVAAVVHQAAGAVAAIPVAGPALAGFLELAVAWYSAASLEPDGSLNVLVAQHYCGTKAGGMDLTAWPIPGVDPGAWQKVVGGMLYVGSSRMDTMLEGFDRLQGLSGSVPRDELTPPDIAPRLFEGADALNAGALPWRAQLTLQMGNSQTTGEG